jgi:hypothetical protein
VADVTDPTDRRRAARRRLIAAALMIAAAFAVGLLIGLYGS